MNVRFKYDSEPRKDIEILKQIDGLISEYALNIKEKINENYFISERNETDEKMQKSSIQAVDSILSLRKDSGGHWIFKGQAQSHEIGEQSQQISKKIV